MKTAAEKIKKTAVKFKLISFDLDGTLLNDKLKLPAISKFGLNKIMKCGYLCIINSSRSLKSILTLIRKIRFSYIVCLNGALVYDNINKETIIKKNIKEKISRKIIMLVIKSGITANIFTSGNVYSTRIESGINGVYQRSLNPVFLDNSNFEKINFNDVLNIELILNDNKRIIGEINKKIGRRVKIFHAGYGYFEIIDKSADKLSGIKIILKKIRVEPKEVIAVGDSLSDYSTMRKSGFGLAMKNCNRKILKAADAVTDKDNNNNGAIEYILKHFV